MTAPIFEPDEVDLATSREADRARRDQDFEDEAIQAAGDKARLWLNEPVVQQAFQNLEDQWLAMFRASKIDQVDVREEAHRLLNVLGKFRQELQHQIESGMIAAKRRQDRATEDAVERMEGESARTF